MVNSARRILFRIDRKSTDVIDEEVIIKRIFAEVFVANKGENRHKSVNCSSTKVSLRDTKIILRDIDICEEEAVFKCDAKLIMTEVCQRNLIFI